jgi:hypothetical protein
MGLLTQLYAGEKKSELVKRMVPFSYCCAWTALRNVRSTRCMGSNVYLSAGRVKIST